MKEFKFDVSLPKFVFGVVVASIFNIIFNFINGGFIGYVFLSAILLSSYFIYDNIINLIDMFFSIKYSRNIRKVNELLETSTKKIKVNNDDVLVMEINSKKISYVTLVKYHEILDNMFPENNIVIIEKDMAFESATPEKLQMYIDNLQKILDKMEVENEKSIKI